MRKTERIFKNKRERNERKKGQREAREGPFPDLLSPCPSGSRAAVPGGCQLAPEAGAFRRHKSCSRVSIARRGRWAAGGRSQLAQEKPEVTCRQVPVPRAGRGSSKG